MGSRGILIEKFYSRNQFSWISQNEGMGFILMVKCITWSTWGLTSFLHFIVWLIWYPLALVSIFFPSVSLVATPSAFKIVSVLVLAQIWPCGHGLLRVLE